MSASVAPPPIIRPGARHGGGPAAGRGPGQGPANTANEVAPGRAIDGLPEGVIDLARSLRRSVDPGPGDGREGPTEAIETGSDELTELLTAPLRLDGRWPAPPAPHPVRQGWIHIEVTDHDRDSLDHFLEDRADLDPDAVAASCQELRWPVSPYRPLRPLAPAPAATGRRPPAPPGPAPDPATIERSALAGAVVVDLSTHWAGPLATKLLAEAGAAVIKIDPDCRPDGFRSRSGLYRHLNGSKQIVDLDLRHRSDRRRFEELLAGADLLVESFSRRVMANLGYDERSLGTRFPGLSMLSVKAFPSGSPEQDWLAFGPGVHAASGLGLIGGDPRPAPLAYPDFLTGLAGFARAAALLSGPRRAEVAEVSLRATIEPLVSLAAASMARRESSVCSGVGRILDRPVEMPDG